MMMDAVMGMVAEGVLPAVAFWGICYVVQYVWGVRDAE
jgi:hypothetical protein